MKPARTAAFMMSASSLLREPRGRPGPPGLPGWNRRPPVCPVIATRCPPAPPAIADLLDCLSFSGAIVLSLQSKPNRSIGDGLIDHGSDHSLIFPPTPATGLSFSEAHQALLQQQTSPAMLTPPSLDAAGRLAFPQHPERFWRGRQPRLSLAPP